MLFLRILTIGELALPSHVKLEEGYRYDIPFDNLMLPCLPVEELLREEGLIEENDRFGFAHPDGYRGLALQANELLQKSSAFTGHIKSFFTRDRFLKEEGVRIRSIRPGMLFFAAVGVGEDRAEELKSRLNGRKHLGIRTGEITGEVELELLNMDRAQSYGVEASPLRKFVSLDYTALVGTPVCFHAPYEEGNKTFLYFPGASVREMLLRQVGTLTEEEKGSLRCSNAYISKHQKRLLPVPACMVVVKLDKKQLRYRLAPGQDPYRVEQTVDLADCFAEDFESHYMEYTAPETEHILSRDGEVYDALTSGQTFCGTIYGSDAAIRKILNHGRRGQTFFIGTLNEQGYGEVYIRLSDPREKEPPAEMPARTFDVSCVSDLLLLNDDGMPTCKAEDLLKEIERILDCAGRLEIEGRYINIYRDYSTNLSWDADGPVVRCIAKGSSLRIRTKDGETVDLFPLLHCFAGERTEDGYGELIAYPARGEYYRLAESVPPVRYEQNFPLPVRGVGLGADFAKAVLASALKSRIHALALADRLGHEEGGSGEPEVPADLLLELRDQCDPTVPEETLIQWYQDAWGGKEDEADPA